MDHLNCSEILQKNCVDSVDQLFETDSFLRVFVQHLRQYAN